MDNISQQMTVGEMLAINDAWTLLAEEFKSVTDKSVESFPKIEKGLKKLKEVFDEYSEEMLSRMNEFGRICFRTYRDGKLEPVVDKGENGKKVNLAKSMKRIVRVDPDAEEQAKRQKRMEIDELMKWVFPSMECTHPSWSQVRNDDDTKIVNRCAKCGWCCLVK